MAQNNIIKVPAYRIKHLNKEKKGFTLSGEPINGGLLPGRSVLHWPSMKQVRLREAEKSPRGGYTLQVKGLKQSLVMKGDYLIPSDWDVRKGKKAYFYCPSGREEEKKNPHREITLMSNPLAREVMTCEGNFRGYLFKARFPHDPLLILGASYEFKEIDSPMVLIGVGDLPRGQSAFVDKALSSWKERDDLFREFLALELGLNGFARLPLEMEHISLPRCERGMGILIRTNKYAPLARSLQKKASAMGGFHEDKIADPLEKQVKDLMLERGEILREKGWLLPVRRGTENHLSPMARQLFDKMVEGKGRLSPSSIKGAGILDSYKAMARMGLIKFNEDLIMSNDSYEIEAEKILKGLKTCKEADLAQLREFSSLSRREILVLLQWMEEDNKVINRDGIREAAH
jgi:hypothetical protein